MSESDSRSTIKGTWYYNESCSSILNSDSGDGNIVWFGSDDGLTPNDEYDKTSFNLSTTLEIHSGQDAGLMFRCGEASTTNNGGPAYYVGLYPASDTVVFGTLDNGWSAKHSESCSLSYNTKYDLKVQAEGDYYTVYVDGTPIIQNVERTEFSSGSVGLRTYRAPTTYYSMTFTDCTVPTEMPTAEPTQSDDLFVKGGSSMSYSEAVDYCQSIGRELASIHSDAENAEALTVCYDDSSTDCWIGAFSTDNTIYGFNWTDNTPWDYTNWGSGEPNDYNNAEDCVHMFYSGQWNDNSCSNSYPPLCRLDAGKTLFFSFYILFSSSFEHPLRVSHHGFTTRSSSSVL